MSRDCKRCEYPGGADITHACSMPSESQTTECGVQYIPAPPESGQTPDQDEADRRLGEIPKAQLGAIILAALNVVDAYRKSLDGPLGKGFTNADFMMLESALKTAGIEPVYETEDSKQ